MRISKKQKRFIRDNFRKMPAETLARRLNAPVGEVRRVLRQMELVAADAGQEPGKTTPDESGPAWAAPFVARLEFLNRYGVAICLVVGVALVLRLIHLAEVMDSPFFRHLHTDPFMYDKWAGKIAEGDWLGRSRPVFYLGPLYPYFLAVIYRIFGSSTLAAGVVQVVLSAASAGLIYHLGLRLFNPVTGLIAGLLAACYGMFIFYSSLILGATLIIFLDLCLLVLLISAMRKRAWWKWTLAGVFLGLSAAARGNVVLFGLLAVPAIAAGFGFAQWKKWLPACMLLGAASLLTISPVTLHNRLFGDDLVPLTANAGANFFIGNNAGSDGIYMRNARYKNRPMGLSVRDQQANFPEVAREELGRDDLKLSEISSFWVGKTLEDIRDNFGGWVSLLGRKVRYLLNAYEVPNNRNYYFSQRFSALLGPPLVTFGCVLPLGLMGMVISCRGWRRHTLPLAFVLAHAAALILFFVNARYRLVIVPVVIVYAAAIVPWCYQQLGRRAYLRLAVVFVLVVVGYVVAYRPVDRIGYRANYLNLANAYRDLGQPEEALTYYDQAIAISHNHYIAYFKKGQVLARLGRNDQARKALDKAMELARRNNDQLNIRRIQSQLRKLPQP